VALIFLAEVLFGVWMTTGVYYCIFLGHAEDATIKQVQPARMGGAAGVPGSDVFARWTVHTPSYDWIVPDGDVLPPVRQMRTVVPAAGLDVRCELDIGSMDRDAVPLDASDTLASVCTNHAATPWSIVAVQCKTNRGAVAILPTLTRGAVDSILRDGFFCFCGSTWATCRLSGAPVLHPMDDGGLGVTCSRPPCTVDVTLDSLDGTAQYLRIVFTGRLQD
jgi:hypothetical protein